LLYTFDATLISVFWKAARDMAQEVIKLRFVDNGQTAGYGLND